MPRSVDTFRTAPADATPGPMLDAAGGGACPRAAAAARGLCGALASEGGEVARVAHGGSVTGDTIAAAALVAASALDVLESAPLAPYWRGYLSSLSDAVEGVLTLVGAASDATVVPLAPQRRRSGPLDVHAAAVGGLDALAVGLVLEAHERGATERIADADAAALIVAGMAAGRTVTAAMPATGDEPDGGAL